MFQCSSPAMLLTSFILLTLVNFAQTIGRTQSTAVEGVLMCEDKPARNVLVKLFEHDTITPDELMDSAESEQRTVKFKLVAIADEIGAIEPKLNIYHDCDDGIKPCQRKLTIFVPSQYITDAKQPSKTFNIGILQLAGKFEGEERDCLHA
ncbi:Transthyretin-like family protein [Ostertagia ostertagi]